MINTKPYVEFWKGFVVKQTLQYNTDPCFYMSKTTFISDFLQRNYKNILGTQNL